MEKDSLIILLVVVGLVMVSAVIQGSKTITGGVVKLGATYEIDAVRVMDEGRYSVDGTSFSLSYGESKEILDGALLTHESSLSSGVRFELSGACKNTYVISATYNGVDDSEEEWGEFIVRTNGEKNAQFQLKEGESKALSDGSKITLLDLHRGSFSGDDRGTNFELVCS